MTASHCVAPSGLGSISCLRTYPTKLKGPSHAVQDLERARESAGQVTQQGPGSGDMLEILHSAAAATAVLGQPPVPNNAAYPPPPQPPGAVAAAAAFGLDLPGQSGPAVLTTAGGVKTGLSSQGPSMHPVTAAVGGSSGTQGSSSGASGSLAGSAAAAAAATAQQAPVKVVPLGAAGPSTYGRSHGFGSPASRKLRLELLHEDDVSRTESTTLAALHLPTACTPCLGLHCVWSRDHSWAPLPELCPLEQSLHVTLHACLMPCRSTAWRPSFSTWRHADLPGSRQG